MRLSILLHKSRHLQRLIYLADWIVWTDLLFKRLENKRRQQVFLRGHTYVSLFIKCYHGNQRGGE
jgi:hypothetical protein